MKLKKDKTSIHLDGKYISTKEYYPPSIIPGTVGYYYEDSDGSRHGPYKTREDASYWSNGRAITRIRK